MREIADEVDAVLMVDMSHFDGFCRRQGPDQRLRSGVLRPDHDPPPPTRPCAAPAAGLVLCQPKLAEHVDRGCPTVLAGPLPYVVAAKAVALAEARTPAFRDYSQHVVHNAAALADGLLRRGITLVTGGTDNHVLLLLDISTHGPDWTASRLAGRWHRRQPQQHPARPQQSLVRLGTPARTTRGPGTAEMDQVAELITMFCAPSQASAPN